MGRTKTLAGISSLPYKYQSTSPMIQETVNKRFHHDSNQFSGSQRTMSQEHGGLALHIPNYLSVDAQIQMLSGTLRQYL